MPRKTTLLLAFVALAGPAGPAWADRLHAPWKLQPTKDELPSVAVYGEPFLEQRLLPVRAASLANDVSVGGKVIARSGTPLFLVFNEKQQIGFCPRKDFSPANQLKTLFMPILDRRACFVDRDANGAFDGIFYVFDKYGTGAAPSGDLRKARPLPKEVPYSDLDPANFPAPTKITFGLSGSKRPEKADIRVRFDKAGTGAWADWVGDFPRAGDVTQVLNTRVRIDSVDEDRAEIELQIDPEIYVIGTGDGFSSSRLPVFVSQYRASSDR